VSGLCPGFCPDDTHQATDQQPNQATIKKHSSIGGLEPWVDVTCGVV